MILSLLVALAAAAIPTHVDLNDLDRWEFGADQILAGPDGCWEMVGRATWDWDFGRWGSSRGDALFVGRLVAGVWQEFHLEPLGEIVRERGRFARESQIYQIEEARFGPLVGKVDGSTVTVAGARSEPQLDDKADEKKSKKAKKREEERGDAVPRNLLLRALDRLSGSVDTSWAQWDAEREGVTLFRDVPITESSRPLLANITAFFPGGREHAVRLDIVFPKRFYWGTLPRWRVDDAVVHVRGRVFGGQVFPTSESFSFEFGVVGLTFSGAQTIRYKSAHRCPVEQIPDAPEFQGPQLEEPDLSDADPADPPLE